MSAIKTVLSVYSNFFLLPHCNFPEAHSNFILSTPPSPPFPTHLSASVKLYTLKSLTQETLCSSEDTQQLLSQSLNNLCYS